MRDYIKNLWDALVSNRQVGSTTALVKAVEDHGGIIICCCENDVKRISSFGIKAVSLHNLKSLRGTREILWFDPSAVESIIEDYTYDVNKDPKSLREFLIQEVYQRSIDLQSLSKTASLKFDTPIIGVLSEISDMEQKGYIQVERGLVRSTIK